MRCIRWTCLLLAACSSPAPQTEPAPLAAELPVPPILNGRRLPARAADARWHFLVAGHLYGDPKQTAMPAASFQRALPQLAASGADLLVCCGDTFRVGVPQCFDATAAVLQQLSAPVFNAVGNHDVVDRQAYTARFGPTFGAFVHGGCAFVLLDTELQTWEIAGEQLAFLRRALAAAAGRADVRAVFCCAHKLVFAHRQRYLEVLLGGNALDGMDEPRPNRFAADVLPLLAAAARTKPVYWIAGDIGTARTLPAFCDRDPSSGVTFLATGIGDLPRDCVLEVEVDGAEVQVSLRPLGGQAPRPLAEYDLRAWSKHVHPDGMPAGLQKFQATLPP